MLHSLPQKAMPLRDPLAAPAEEEIQLDCLPLYVGPVVFFKGGYLGRKADPVLTNLVPEFVQAELFNLFCVIRACGTVGPLWPGL